MRQIEADDSKTLELRGLRAATDDTEGTTANSIPWGQLVLAATIPLVSMGSLVNFSPLLPLVREEFGLSNAWAGMLASASIFSHTLLQLPGGQIADSLGVKRSMVLGSLLIGTSVIASGLATTFPVLLFFRFTLGLGSAIGFIAGLSFVNAMVPANRRALAQGLFGAAGNAGVLLVLLLAERLALAGGWRGAFVIEGLAALSTTLLMIILLRPNVGRAVYASEPWSETLRTLPLYLLGLAHILTYGLLMALFNWVPTFLWQKNGIGLEWAGPLAALMAVTAVLGRSMGGKLASGRERPVIVVACVATAVFAIAVPLAPNIAAVLMALLAFGWFASMPFGAIFSYYSVFSGKKTSGKAFSLINFVANTGALVFPPAVGYALDVTGSFAVGFGVVGAAGLAGSVVVARLLPRNHRD